MHRRFKVRTTSFQSTFDSFGKRSHHPSHIQQQQHSIIIPRVAPPETHGPAQAIWDSKRIRSAESGAEEGGRSQSSNISDDVARAASNDIYDRRRGGESPEELARMCRRVTIAGGVTNLFFAVVKTALGSADGGSRALLADGMHAAIDLCADSVSFLAVSTRGRQHQAAKGQTTQRHKWFQFSKCRWPYGPGRIETAASLAISLLLVSGALAILKSTLAALYEQLTTTNEHYHHHHDGHTHGSTHHENGGCCGGGAGHSHFDVKSAYLESQTSSAEGSSAKSNNYFLAAMFCASLSSLVAKEFLYRWGKRVGEKAGSAVLIANATHHRADAWSSSIGLVGVAGAAIGVPMIDQLAALCVSTVVLSAGSRMSIQAGQEFLGYQPKEYEQRSGSIDRIVELDVGGGRKSSDSGDSLKRRIAMVNVGIIRHGHTLHVSGLLAIPSNGVGAVEIKEATEVLERRFKDEFECCCPDVEVNYRMVVVDPTSSSSGSQDDSTTTTTGIRQSSLVQRVADYHQMPELVEKFEILRNASSCDKSLVSSSDEQGEGGLTNATCPLCGELRSQHDPCLRDLDALRRFYYIKC